jgi:hypothetical protein
LIWDLPSAELKAQILDLGEDLISAWITNSGGGDAEYFSSSGHEWIWDEAGMATPNPATWDDLKMGASALAAAVYRVKRPRDLTFRQTYRYYVIDTIDEYVDTNIGADGKVYRGGVDWSGQAAWFAITNILVAAKALGLKTRWRDKVLLALDENMGRGELTYYTNGNFALSKSLSFYAGAWMSEWDPDRVADFETSMDFLGGISWRGCGFVEDTASADTYGVGGKGYFSEVLSTDPATDHSEANRYDPEYTILQAELSGLGFVLSGDTRYATACTAITNKLRDNWTSATNQVDCSNGSRHPSTSYSLNMYGSAMLLSRGLFGESYSDADLQNQIDGVDDDLRNYLTNSNVGIYRAAGYTAAALVLASHGVILDD